MERLPLSEVVNEVNTISELGIPAIMLFGIQVRKIEGTSAFVEREWLKSNSRVRKILVINCHNGRCLSLSVYNIRTLWTYS